jgi:hypothetical protein
VVLAWAFELVALECEGADTLLVQCEATSTRAHLLSHGAAIVVDVEAVLLVAAASHTPPHTDRCVQHRASERAYE